MSITINAGGGRSISRPAHLYPTPDSVLRDRSLQAQFGYSDSSSEIHVNGTLGAASIADGDTVSIVPRTNTKG